MNSLVSIIVPVYGTEAYLPSCIESICNQSYKNIQIILIDDQSPDKCPQICDDYAQKDHRIQVIHQKNKGVSGARNTGIRYATGKYIMFVDSDDKLNLDAIALLLYEAERLDADIVSGTMKHSGKWENFNVGYTDIKKDVFCDDEFLLLSLKGESGTQSSCAKLFKKNIVNDIWFEEGKSIHEDGFFVFQCCLKKPLFIRLNVPIYQYNTRENSSSRQAFSDKYLSMLYFCERKKEIISATFPQYIDHLYNMEARTHLQLLDVLCSSTDKTYKDLQKICVKTVRKLKKYHIPVNSHHKKLAEIVTYGLYPVYKIIVRFKYYR